MQTGQVSAVAATSRCYNDVVSLTPAMCAREPGGVANFKCDDWARKRVE